MEEYPITGLFNGNGFREIAGLIHVCAFENGDVIGEKLNRDGVKDWGHNRVNFGQLDRGDRHVAKFFDAGTVGQENHPAAPRDYFLHVGSGLFEQIVVMGPPEHQMKILFAVRSGLKFPTD